MNTETSKKIALACLALCIIVWIPNIIFQVASPLWMATFILGIVGVAFAALARNYWLVAANLVMTFSFFIFMAIGYLFAAQIV